MRNLFKVFLALGATVAIASCAKEYDDTELKGKVDALDKKVSTLERKWKLSRSRSPVLPPPSNSGRKADS